MFIESNFQKDVPVPQKPDGAYEWWYFDALSDDAEWGLVFIFYQGNPFSPYYIMESNKGVGDPVNYPALSISVYHKERAEYYSFLEYDQSAFEWSEEGKKLSIAGNTITQEIREGQLCYDIDIDQRLESGHQFSAQLTFISIPDAVFDAPEKDDSSHSWNLIQPVARVNGRLRISGRTANESVHFRGTGYHDHNTGFEPMKDSFREWYWGRFHFPDHTFIYYVMERHDHLENKGWLIENQSFEITDTISGMIRKDHLLTPFGLESARRLEFISGQRQITVYQHHLLDNGPFYQRFKSEAVMVFGMEKQSAYGISEYIRPDRIYSKLFWPMVKMRLRSEPQGGHWVQSSRRMYEWTW